MGKPSGLLPHQGPQDKRRPTPSSEKGPSGSQGSLSPSSTPVAAIPDPGAQGKGEGPLGSMLSPEQRTNSNSLDAPKPREKKRAPFQSAGEGDSSPHAGAVGQGDASVQATIYRGKARSGVGSPQAQLSREGHPLVVLSGVRGAKEEHPTPLCPLRRQASYMWALAWRGFPKRAQRPQVSMRWRPGMKREIAGRGNQREEEVSRNPPPAPTNLLKLTKSLSKSTRHGWATPTKGATFCYL